jgi:hypothetical protein
MRTLWLMALVTLAPLIASYAAYYVFPRESRVNYGTLRLPTRPMPDIAGMRADGTPFRFDQLRGRWVLVSGAHGGCDGACVSNLVAGRQARTMQGKDQDRIVRVLLVAGASPPAALVAEHPALVVVTVSDAALSALSGGADALQLVDPLGNLVLDYPRAPDIKGVAADLARLLKASRIG